ncbi:unnamed protein product [Acanthosepion pharaonis]|uniref:Uncharacterized protein n=1 Tax=Acanthosepion pharaonis TaxID=158019 RepID=A0A812CUY5_ACAPH|nr:unnamed protein product [Sepia pharaonis]
MRHYTSLPLSTGCHSALLPLSMKCHSIALSLLTECHSVPLSLLTECHSVPLSINGVSFCTPVSINGVSFCSPVSINGVSFCTPVSINGVSFNYVVSSSLYSVIPPPPLPTIMHFLAPTHLSLLCSLSSSHLSSSSMLPLALVSLDNVSTPHAPLFLPHVIPLSLFFFRLSVSFLSFACRCHFSLPLSLVCHSSLFHTLLSSFHSTVLSLSFSNHSIISLYLSSAFFSHPVVL